MTMSGEEGQSLTAAERFGRAAKVFLDPRMLVVLLLGFSSGLPLALSGSTLLIWMQDTGVDLGIIGLYSLVGTAYTFKFFWAPLVDAYDIPLLGRLLGHRRGWLIFTQVLLMAAICLLGSLDPLTAPLLIAVAAVGVAAVSATQDIVIDAFRVEYLRVDQQAAGMTYFVAAYRVGMLVSGGGTVWLVGYLEAQGVDRSLVWSYGYAATALLVLLGMAAVLMAKEPASERPPEETESESGDPAQKRMGRFLRTATEAFKDFLQKNDAILILLFVVLFKLCDVFAGVMTGPFVIDIGFDKTTYAEIVKGVGFFATLIGGFAGGVIARAMPLFRALFIAGVLQMVSNLVFCWQAWVGVDPAALALTISAENFTGGVGTVIFVAYLSSLCTSRAFTATQYALLSALAAVGRTTLGAGSGFLADWLGWIAFFAASALAALPGLALLIYLQSRGDFAPIHAQEKSVSEAA
jgi:PAT family beta-lactamase induction signal transducer AmpG